MQTSLSLESTLDFNDHDQSRNFRRMPLSSDISLLSAFSSSLLTFSSSLTNEAKDIKSLIEDTSSRKHSKIRRIFDHHNHLDVSREYLSDQSKRISKVENSLLSLDDQINNCFDGSSITENGGYKHNITPGDQPKPLTDIAILYQNLHDCNKQKLDSVKRLLNQFCDAAPERRTNDDLLEKEEVTEDEESMLVSFHAHLTKKANADDSDVLEQVDEGRSFDERSVPEGNSFFMSPTLNNNNDRSMLDTRHYKVPATPETPCLADLSLSFQANSILVEHGQERLGNALNISSEVVEDSADKGDASSYRAKQLHPYYETVQREALENNNECHNFISSTGSDIKSFRESILRLPSAIIKTNLQQSPISPEPEILPDVTVAAAESVFPSIVSANNSIESDYPFRQDLLVGQQQDVFMDQQKQPSQQNQHRLEGKFGWKGVVTKTKSIDDSKPARVNFRDILSPTTTTYNLGVHGNERHSAKLLRTQPLEPSLKKTSKSLSWSKSEVIPTGHEYSKMQAMKQYGSENMKHNRMANSSHINSVSKNLDASNTIDGGREDAHLVERGGVITFMQDQEESTISESDFFPNGNITNMSRSGVISKSSESIGSRMQLHHQMLKSIDASSNSISSKACDNKTEHDVIMNEQFQPLNNSIGLSQASPSLFATPARKALTSSSTQTEEKSLRPPSALIIAPRVTFFNEQSSEKSLRTPSAVTSTPHVAFFNGQSTEESTPLRQIESRRKETPYQSNHISHHSDYMIDDDDDESDTVASTNPVPTIRRNRNSDDIIHDKIVQREEDLQEQRRSLDDEFDRQVDYHLSPISKNNLPSPPLRQVNSNVIHLGHSSLTPLTDAFLAKHNLSASNEKPQQKTSGNFAIHNENENSDLQANTDKKEPLLVLFSSDEEVGMGSKRLQKSTITQKVHFSNTIDSIPTNDNDKKENHTLAAKPHLLKTAFIDQAHKSRYAIIEEVTREEYDAAPRVVKMQVCFDQVNNAVQALNIHLSSVKKGSRVTTFNEEDAQKILNHIVTNEKKARSILMSLCHWKKMIMVTPSPDSGFNGGKVFHIN
eukprot:CAMPEP_0194368958 /NCGR_PEP_ID=MMETSP0174-20130528/17201_1 /TAXON_ID=216777 /ORGANISM="Proboscia alata, Strain PI-D3" /LENGTH=1058 /DNA_ID=CAMNT_0039145601 /DNA_START=27 /DNA_END=3203 /DNA_ORIENTATION=+